jgi:hypothetical protein
MSQSWQYQIRLYLTEVAAKMARRDIDNPLLAPLIGILRNNNADPINILDAFEHYVEEAEERGIENFPLYRWTKAVVADPEKRGKHAKVFALHVAGSEVYPEKVADALETELQPLVGGELIMRMTKHDTNPENNPQIPPDYRS